MRELTYYVGVSLDGYIAGPDDEVGFFPVSADHVEYMAEQHPEVLPSAARRQMGIDDLPNRVFDTVIMGRRTYQPALDLDITDPYAHLRTYVASSRGVAEARPPVTVVVDPVATVRALKSEPSGLGIWCAGGGQLAAALTNEIDQLILKSYPVLAGEGTPVLAGRFSPQAFRPTSSTTFSSGCTITTYARA